MSIVMALGLVLVAGCAGEKSDMATPANRSASPSASPKTGVQLAEPLLQDRLDGTRRLLTVPLVNRGPGPVRVSKVGLVSPRFSPVPPTAVDGELAVDQQINFSIPYGTAQCTRKSADESLTVVAGGETRTLALAPPVNILDRLWRTECDAKRLEAAFTVGWGATWTQVPGAEGEADRLTGALIATPTGKEDEDVTLTDFTGSVLFAVDSAPAGRRPLATLKPGRNEVPVQIDVRLCSKHGLTEAKRIFEFTLYARLGDADPVYRTIIPPEAVQQQVLALLKTCPDEG
jgi:hypothetical protein